MSCHGCLQRAPRLLAQGIVDSPLCDFHSVKKSNDLILKTNLLFDQALIETGARVVAPLFPLSNGPTPLGRLEPIIEIGGIVHVLHPAELAAVPSGVLKGQSLVDLREHDYKFRDALDMVFSGF